MAGPSAAAGRDDGGHGRRVGDGGKIGGRQRGRQHLADDAVGSGQLAGGAVTTRHLGDGAVTAEKLADQAVAEKHLADGAVSFRKLGFTPVESGHGDRVMQQAEIVAFTLAEGQSVDTVQVEFRRPFADRQYAVVATVAGMPGFAVLIGRTAYSATFSVHQVGGEQPAAAELHCVAVGNGCQPGEEPVRQEETIRYDSDSESGMQAGGLENPAVPVAGEAWPSRAVPEADRMTDATEYEALAQQTQPTEMTEPTGQSEQAEQSALAGEPDPVVQAERTVLAGQQEPADQVEAPGMPAVPERTEAEIVEPANDGTASPPEGAGGPFGNIGETAIVADDVTEAAGSERTGDPIVPEAAELPADQAGHAAHKAQAGEAPPETSGQPAQAIAENGRPGNKRRRRGKKTENP